MEGYIHAESLTKRMRSYRWKLEKTKGGGRNYGHERTGVSFLSI